MNESLPISELREDIVRLLQSGNQLVLVAPTGSGKTTQVPQILLDAGLAGSRDASGDLKRIVVLQPRRVAARTVAARVAWERNVPLGGEVGYQIRFEDHTSLGTRICFVTEGILLRWLQDDRKLSDVAAVLFDEFHERNLLSDVALALVKQLQRTDRPDLKIVVMSATLDAEPIADYLARSPATVAGAAPASGKACPILISEGISFPVEIQYLSHPDERPLTEQAADAVEAILKEGEAGDILIFMPGMGEINSTISALRAMRTGEKLALIPLHGELPSEEQDRAFAPNPLRKIVIATNVAETSVTIDGIRHVVDSGTARISRYDSERGISTLFIEPISRASADQRRGRAGRTGPGTCHRLWTESGHLNRAERNTPEIQRSDLAEVVLLLHSLGVKEANRFDWLDRPDPQAIERAEKLLRTLGALATAGEGAVTGGMGAGAGPEAKTRPESDVTPIGREMLRLPMHPRYSRMLIEAVREGCLKAAALCAALAGGRDLMMRLGRDDKHIAEARELFEGSQDSDFFTLMRAYQFARKNNFAVESCRRYGIHGQTARQVAQTYEQILEIVEKRALAGKRGAISDGGEEPVGKGKEQALERCLMAGFIDQLCVRRDQGTLECELTEGRRGTLMRESVVQNATLFVAATIREVMGRGSEPLTLLGLATLVKREWVLEMFPDQVSIVVEHLFDRTHKRVAAVKLIRFQDLVIGHEHQREVEGKASGRALAEAWRKGWFELPLFNHEIKQFINRVNLVARVRPEAGLPLFDQVRVTELMGEAFEDLTLVKEAQAAPLKETFRKALSREQQEWLDELAPLQLAWPGSKPVKLLYPDATEDDDEPPAELQAKLHECFGARGHPSICDGKSEVRVWLLTPDGKRIDSTFDWPTFRSTQYPKLKAGLQKKFPGTVWV